MTPIEHQVTLWRPWPDMTTTAVTLTYDPTDPYAITARFPSPTGRTGGLSWTFARELLVAAVELGHATGEGDVHVELSDGWVWLTLHPEPGCTLTYLLSHPNAMAFLNATYDVVPVGIESGFIDWPTELAHLREPA